MSDAEAVIVVPEPASLPLLGFRQRSRMFQSFALFPWLSVEENVELGLEARGVPKKGRERRAEGAIVDP